MLPLTGKVALVYSDEYLKYFLGKSHPLRPQRLKLTVELMREIGLLDHPDLVLVEPRMASLDELKLVHSDAYLQRVKEMDKLGVPAIFRGAVQALAMKIKKEADRKGAKTPETIRPISSLIFISIKAS